MNGVHRVKLTDSHLQIKSTKAIRVVVKQDNKAPVWSLSGVTLEGEVSEKSSKASGEAFMNIYILYLRSCLTDTAFFNVVNKAIVQLACDETKEVGLRLHSIKLLCLIISLNSEQA